MVSPAVQPRGCCPGRGASSCDGGNGRRHGIQHGSASGVQPAIHRVAGWPKKTVDDAHARLCSRGKMPGLHQIPYWGTREWAGCLQLRPAVRGWAPGLERSDGDAGAMRDADEAVGAWPAPALQDVDEGVASDPDTGRELPP